MMKQKKGRKKWLKRRTNHIVFHSHSCQRRCAVSNPSNEQSLETMCRQPSKAINLRSFFFFWKSKWKETKQSMGYGRLSLISFSIQSLFRSRLIHFAINSSTFVPRIHLSGGLEVWSQAKWNPRKHSTSSRLAITYQTNFDGNNSMSGPMVTIFLQSASHRLMWWQLRHSRQWKIEREKIWLPYMSADMIRINNVKTNDKIESHSPAMCLFNFSFYFLLQFLSPFFIVIVWSSSSSLDPMNVAHTPRHTTLHVLATCKICHKFIWKCVRVWGAGCGSLLSFRFELWLATTTFVSASVASEKEIAKSELVKWSFVCALNASLPSSSSPPSSSQTIIDALLLSFI